MPTKHDPPRPSQGETTKRGRRARKPGQTERQRAIDPQKLLVVREMMVGNVDYYEIQATLSARWGVSMRTIRNYRARVLADMRAELETDGFLDPSMEAMLAIQRIEDARLRAIRAKDLRAELRLIELRARICGVIGPDRHLHLHAPPPQPLPTAPGQPQLEAPAQPLDPAQAARRELAQRIAARLGQRQVEVVIDMQPAGAGEEA